jgi:hypothetical protein
VANRLATLVQTHFFAARVGLEATLRCGRTGPEAAYPRKLNVATASLDCTGKQFYCFTAVADTDTDCTFPAIVLAKIGGKQTNKQTSLKRGEIFWEIKSTPSCWYFVYDDVTKRM